MQAQRISFDGLHVRLDCALRQLSPACRSWPHSHPHTAPDSPHRLLRTGRIGCGAEVDGVQGGVHCRHRPGRQVCRGLDLPYHGAPAEPEPEPEPQPEPEPEPKPQPLVCRGLDLCLIAML